MKNQRLIFVVATIVCLVPLASFGAEWRVPGDYATIQAAINSTSVLAGDKIIVGSGEHAGALVTKAVEIKGEDGAAITSGPAHSSGLIMGFRMLAGSNGCSISHLRFTVDLAIMNGDAVHDVSVSHCTFENSIQAVSNWRGNSWQITHNDIIDLRTRNGGGIGVLIGDFTGGTVVDNVVAHNKITGALHMGANEKGKYNGSGIVLYADFRWGRLGAAAIQYNQVMKNKIAMTSDNPVLVDIVAVELTDTRNNPGIIPPVINNNKIMFNDWRDTAKGYAWTPDNLDAYNAISRNLGKNRGHGLHPHVFGPE
jgi:hypothetical protein